MLSAKTRSLSSFVRFTFLTLKSMSWTLCKLFINWRLMRRLNKREFVWPHGSFSLCIKYIRWYWESGHRCRVEICSNLSYQFHVDCIAEFSVDIVDYFHNLSSFLISGRDSRIWVLSLYFKFLLRRKTKYPDFTYFCTAFRDKKMFF